jgi:uroporphyrinogen-III synthase
MASPAPSVLSFESRRRVEIAELIRLNGGTPFVAPALREVPIADNQAVFEFAATLYAGGFDMVILLTGVGTRYLHKILATQEPEDRFPAALRRVSVVVRGPKPAAVMREWKVPVAVSVPEPNTWRELLNAVEGRPERSVAVQEYGRSNPELLAGLRDQGRNVTRVPVYQWKLPLDTQPLAEALERLLAKQFDMVFFTTSVQIDHFLEFAERAGQRDPAIRALQQGFVASVGPDCSDALRSHGIAPNFEPSHPKMGILVREAMQAYNRQEHGS